MKISFISLGCAKNLVDTEFMMGVVKKNGCLLTGRTEEAQAVVVNTCAFIDAATEESLAVIRKLAREKSRSKTLKKLIVTGCLPQKYGYRLLEWVPEIDHILGVSNLERIYELIKQEPGEGGKSLPRLEIQPPGPVYPRQKHDRLLSTPGHYAYLKIAEGCDNRCHYCIIPRLRGPYRSRKMEDITEEAEYLVDRGVKELILVAQDTTFYGRDIYGKFQLARLLQELAKIRGLYWIRLLYTHPSHFTDELIETIAGLPQVCNYIDLPLQHINDRLLKKMGRPYDSKTVYDLLEKLRRRIDDPVLRSTFIIGYPGESKSDFKELTDFLEFARFQRVGFFIYSPQKGTVAYELPGRIPAQVSRRRLKKISQIQDNISLEENRKLLGKTMPVLVDGFYRDPPAWQGRTMGHCPDVDGVVYIDSYLGRPGELVDLRIIQAGVHDLVGTVLSADTSSGPRPAE